MRQKDRKLPARKMIQELLVAATAERERLYNACPDDRYGSGATYSHELAVAAAREQAFIEALETFTDLPS